MTKSQLKIKQQISGMGSSLPQMVKKGSGAIKLSSGSITKYANNQKFSNVKKQSSSLTVSWAPTDSDEENKKSYECENDSN
jgi:hypothetical protein